MAKVDVLNWKKEKVSQVELPKEVFEAPVRKDLIHTVVRWQRAQRRQGTHKTKSRSEVSGGGKKPFKQKGTGNARQGSIRSPLNRGGGVVFGTSPRDHSYSLPKKIRQQALCSALSYLKEKGNLYVVKDMKSSGKTKELDGHLKKFGLKKSILMDSQVEESFQRASGNLKNFCYYPVMALNVYDLLRYDCLVLTEQSVGEIVKKCGGLN